MKMKVNYVQLSIFDALEGSWSCGIKHSLGCYINIIIFLIKSKTKC